MCSPFRTILLPGDPGTVDEAAAAPEPFRDLHLDQVVAFIADGCRDFDVRPYYRAAPTDPDAIAYRQEVMRELEREPVLRCVEAFCDRLRKMRSELGLIEQLDYPREKQRWFLSAAQAYCEAVEGLAADLEGQELTSRGLRALRGWLAEYVGSERFRGLARDVADRVAELSGVRYGLRIEGSSVTVVPIEGEPDYTAAVEATFAKFRHGAVKDYRAKLSDSGRLDHVEAQVLDRVALLFPAVFEALAEFAATHADFVDATLARFDREVHFYLGYLRFTEKLRASGLSFCYPRLSATCKEVSGRNAFDLALAAKLVPTGTAVVVNDFCLRGAERVLVVSGPNHGGKTTFARMFGQIHYLARLGCPVPGTEARLFLFDQLFTHFEREEDIRDLRGKLHDDLVRIRRILDRATPSSIVVLNEIFASTTLRDAICLSRRVMAEISRRDLLCVCVTFLEELASFDEKAVSMVSTVDPADPAIRTFRLERRPADGLAYALAVAEKHGVTYERLKERIPE